MSKTKALDFKYHLTRSSKRICRHIQKNVRLFLLIKSCLLINSSNFMLNLYDIFLMWLFQIVEIQFMLLCLFENHAHFILSCSIAFTGWNSFNHFDFHMESRRTKILTNFFQRDAYSVERAPATKRLEGVTGELVNKLHAVVTWDKIFHRFKKEKYAHQPTSIRRESYRIFTVLK